MFTCQLSSHLICSTSNKQMSWIGKWCTPTSVANMCCFLSPSIDSLVDWLNDQSFPHSVNHSAMTLDTGQFCVAQFPIDHKFSYSYYFIAYHSLYKVVSWYNKKLQQI